jgi:hypothetical protein
MAGAVYNGNSSALTTTVDLTGVTTRSQLDFKWLLSDEGSGLTNKSLTVTIDNNAGTVATHNLSGDFSAWNTLDSPFDLIGGYNYTITWTYTNNYSSGRAVCNRVYRRRCIMTLGEVQDFEMTFPKHILLRYRVTSPIITRPMDR